MSSAQQLKPLLQVMDITMLNDQDQVQDENTTFRKEIKPRIKHDLKNRYLSAEITHLLDKCTFVDKWFKHSFTLDDDTVKEILTEIENLANAEHPTSVAPQPEPPPAKQGKFSQLFGSVLGISTSNSTALPADREKRYVSTISFTSYRYVPSEILEARIIKNASPIYLG